MSLPIKCKLPEGFLDKEVRCGYEVSEKLKKIWAVEIDLLQEFLRVCKIHDIPVQIFGGTLLGAVRHKGFIPWDDDLDVCITREAFNKLCSVAHEFKHPYFFQTALSDRRFFLPFARLRNSLTTGSVDSQKGVEYNNGIYIDIYVMEGYVDNRWLWLFQNILIMIAVKPCTLYYQDVPRNGSLKELILRLPRPFVRLFPYEMWVKLYYKTLGLFTKMSSRVGLRHELSQQAKRYFLTKNQQESTILVDFEWLRVPAPADYDEILSHIYGNYMTYPPVESRGAWHAGYLRFEPEIPYYEFYSRGNLLNDGK